VKSTNASEPELSAAYVNGSNSDFERSDMTDNTRPSLHTIDVEKGVKNGGSSNYPPHKRGFWSRIYRSFRANYWPSEEPALILPSPPTDEEKILYLRTNRLPLYIFGVFAFLTLSAGMWLFTIWLVYSGTPDVESYFTIREFQKIYLEEFFINFIIAHLLSTGSVFSLCFCKFTSGYRT
jgi:hypothetical protein